MGVGGRGTLVLVSLRGSCFRNKLCPLMNDLSTMLGTRGLVRCFELGSLPIVCVQRVSSERSTAFFLPSAVKTRVRDDITPVGGRSVVVGRSPGDFCRARLGGLLRSGGVASMIVYNVVARVYISTAMETTGSLKCGYAVVRSTYTAGSLRFRNFGMRTRGIRTIFLTTLAPFCTAVVSASRCVGSYLAALWVGRGRGGP